MPIYEYKCRDCGNITEIFQKTSAPKTVNCRHCSSDDTEKIFSTPALIKAAHSSAKGTTCCGRTERCDTPPCSIGEGCGRDRR
jgi:putative FmdB family regulatory protein